jgi:hypothetical protein
MHHLSRHLVHVVLIVSALVVLRVADVELGTLALVSLLAVCLALFEGGMWVIHRRDAVRSGATR